MAIRRLQSEDTSGRIFSIDNWANRKFVRSIPDPNNPEHLLLEQERIERRARRLPTLKNVLVARAYLFTDGENVFASTLTATLRCTPNQAFEYYKNVAALFADDPEAVARLANVPLSNIVIDPEDDDDFLV